MHALGGHCARAACNFSIYDFCPWGTVCVCVAVHATSFELVCVGAAAGGRMKRGIADGDRQSSRRAAIIEEFQGLGSWSDRYARC